MSEPTKQNAPLPHQPRQALSCAIAMALAAAGISHADTFSVTANLDDGTGMTNHTLSRAILQANNNPGPDVIELNTDVTLTGVMKRLIDSDVTLQSDATHRRIDGNHQFRPLFIKSGQVHIQDITIENGLAKGGSTGRGGAGAGLGGGLFIYAGHVHLSDVTFNQNTAVGGDINLPGINGGGGMFGQGNYYAGGGLFGDAIGNFVSGGYGGYGQYQTSQAPNFGAGGGYVSTYEAASGGFGGGAAFSYESASPGGFGGGGGFSYNYDYQNFFGGRGGFGGGGGSNMYGPSNDGLPGFGGHRQHAAGLGGGVFIRSGQMVLEGVTFSNNQAQNSGQAWGLGGGLFIMHSTTQNNGNNQGMPAALARVYGCSLVTNNNLAASDPNNPNNNDDVFDAAGTQTGLSGPTSFDPCLFDQDIQLLGNGSEITAGDTTPSLIDGTDFGSVMANYQARSQTFVLNNLGTSGLVLTGLETIELAGQSNGRFTLATTPLTHVPGNQGFAFRIEFLPTNFTTYQETVTIRSNDPDEPVYTFTLHGQGIPYSELIFASGFD